MQHARQAPGRAARVLGNRNVKLSQQNLAERLGYRRDDRLLIVNCDDLGSSHSHSANVATFRSMTCGIATSATLMVRCP
jgi:hypothetical protein